MPVSLPLSSGMTFPTALAAPVEAGTVVMRPSSMPKVSLTTFARGARQLVVQDALETTFMEDSYFSSLTTLARGARQLV